MRVALATSNEGKRRELAKLVAELGWELELPSPSVSQTIQETGNSFVENALIKARIVAEATGLPTLADDSGLMVDALGGQPGIHSARFAGEHGNDTKNNQKLLHNLHHLTSSEQRRATFVCVLVLMQDPNDPLPQIGIGSWRGTIAKHLSGAGGFGYDPLFYLHDQDCTVAELSDEVKNRNSHRYKAWMSLRHNLKSS